MQRYFFYRKSAFELYKELESYESSIIIIDIIILTLSLYRNLCYTYFCLQLLVVLNPYLWPYSVIRTICAPYIEFWRKIVNFPFSGINIGFDFSSFVGLEILSIFINIFSKVKILEERELEILLSEAPSETLKKALDMMK